MGLEDVINASGIKALYDQTASDNATIQDLIRQEKNGEPIDLDAAHRVEQNIDAFMEAIKQLPWGARMALGQGKLKKIQDQVHEHIKKLEELSKTQGIVNHEPIVSEPIIKEIIKEPIIQKDTQIQNEIPKVIDVTSNIISTTKLNEKVEQSTNPINRSEALEVLLKGYYSVPEYNGDYEAPTENEYKSIIKLWNERLIEASRKSYDLAQEEIINDIASKYEGFAEGAKKDETAK